jgi:hypothetical protein
MARKVAPTATDGADVEAEASDEIVYFLQIGNPGVDLPLLRSRLNQLRCKGASGSGGGGGGGGGGNQAKVLLTPERQREISE